MKIRYLNNGSEKHVPTQVGQGFIDAGLAVLVSNEPEPGVTRDEMGMLTIPAPKPGAALIPERKWAVTVLKGIRPEPVLALVMNQGAAVIQFTGVPKFLRERRTWQGADGADGGFRWLHGFGCEIPDAIVREYTKQWNANEHLRGPYDPKPNQLHDYNIRAAENLREANEKERRKEQVALSDREVEAALVKFNREFNARYE